METVHTKGKKGYRLFKECLRESDQGHHVDHLERNEKEIKQTARKKTTLTNGKVSDEDLAKVANRLGNNLELLGPALGLMDIEMDHLNCYTVQQVSGAVMPVSIQRSKLAGVMQQNVKGDLRVQPVEIPVSICSESKDSENKYKQIEEQSWSSNFMDEGHVVIELPEQQSQEIYNGSKANSSEKLTIVEYQIDGSGTPTSDQTVTTVKTSHKNFNVSLKSVDSIPVQATHELNKKVGESTTSASPHPVDENTESRPLQDTHSFNEKIDGAIGLFSDLKISFSRSEYISKETNIHADREIRKMLKEEFKPLQWKPLRKCTHDGRLLIGSERVFRYIKCFCNRRMPIRGGFGDVYISERKIPGLEIEVALKEINYAECSQYEYFATNVKLASRIMHFSIVPLLAMGCNTSSDERICWFLSPCLDNRDLYTLIEKDTKRIEENALADIELTRQRRVKILYHISAAIDFLHTKIENFRGAIIHLDVKTRNVVLDRFYNARLTDFGVARETARKETSIETSQTSVPLTKGYFQPPTYDKLAKYSDYYNLGIVIRELLTGKPPCFKDSEDQKEEFLKDLDVDDTEDYIQECIWKSDEELCQTLLTLSKRCTDSATRSGESKADKLQSRDILKEMERLCRGYTWDRLPAKEQNPDDDNCEICMVNPPVGKDLLSHAENCKWPLKVCLSCMRNSYLNPLRCHSCFQEIDPVISSKWGALLIAGRYDNDVCFTKSCAKDVADIKRVIVSKCPLIMGIRESNVRTIAQRDITSPEFSCDTISQIQRAFNDLKKVDVKKIFFYYSGHCTNKDGFIMKTRQDNTNVYSEEQKNTRECLSFSDFEKMLRSFLVENHGQAAQEIDKKCIIILDCREAPVLRFNDISKNIVQLNASRPNQEDVQQPEGTGSLFKKIFIQALTMKSTKGDCFLQRGLEPCGICPVTGEDFITIGSLNTYIGRHMDEYQKRFCKESPQKPVQNATSDVKIAYLVDTTAEISFTLTFSGTQKDCFIPCHFFSKISELKETLFNEYMDKMKIDKEREKGSKLQLEANSYHDILQIVIKTGPKDKYKHELNSLEQVMSAWNGKREQYVEMREVSMIKDGPVGVFKDNTRNFLSFLDNYEHRKQEEESHTTHKIDLTVFMKEVKGSGLEQLRKGIRVYRIKEQQSAELHIIRPCMIDENGLRKMREDFVCFKLEKIKTLETADAEPK